LPDNILAIDMDARQINPTDTPETYAWYLQIPAASVTPYVEQLLRSLGFMEWRLADAKKELAKLKQQAL
jgi:hypothetical protein